MYVLAQAGGEGTVAVIEHQRHNRCWIKHLWPTIVSGPFATVATAESRLQSKRRRRPQTGGHLFTEPEDGATFLQRQLLFPRIIREDIGGQLLSTQAVFTVNKGQSQRRWNLARLSQMKWFGSTGVSQELNWRLLSSCRLNGLYIFWQHCANTVQDISSSRLYVFSTFALTKAGWKQLMSQKPVWIRSRCNNLCPN